MPQEYYLQFSQEIRPQPFRGPQPRLLSLHASCCKDMHFTGDGNMNRQSLQQILAVEDAVGGGFGQMFREDICAPGQVGDGPGQPDDA